MWWVVKKINNTDLWEIRHHMENTSKDLVKWYTLGQLSLMDWITPEKIKSSNKYLPIRVDTAQSLLYYKNWTAKKPYMILWIRLDEIKYIFNKRYKGLKLEIENNIK
jgi:hypothetical protein